MFDCLGCVQHVDDIRHTSLRRVVAPVSYCLRGTHRFCVQHDLEFGQPPPYGRRNNTGDATSDNPGDVVGRHAKAAIRVARRVATKAANSR